MHMINFIYKLLILYESVSLLGTVSMSGTSMACPHVAGAAALLLDEFPRASPDAIRSLLIGASCSDIDERRMHPALQGLTPNRRLKVRRGE